MPPSVQVSHLPPLQCKSHTCHHRELVQISLLSILQCSFVTCMLSAITESYAVTMLTALPSQLYASYIPITYQLHASYIPVVCWDHADGIAIVKRTLTEVLACPFRGAVPSHHHIIA